MLMLLLLSNTQSQRRDAENAEGRRENLNACLKSRRMDLPSLLPRTFAINSIPTSCRTGFLCGLCFLCVLCVGWRSFQIRSQLNFAFDPVPNTFNAPCSPTAFGRENTQF